MKFKDLKKIIIEEYKKIKFENKQLLNEEWITWGNIHDYCSKCAKRGKCCESSAHGWTGAEMACTKCFPTMFLAQRAGAGGRVGGNAFVRAQPAKDNRCLKTKGRVL